MERRQDGGEDWASRLADAVRDQLRGRLATLRLQEIELQSVRAVSTSAVEVVWSWGGENLLGLRLQRSEVSRASERIRASDLGELAFDVVLVGVQEPRSPEEFTPPDDDGIRWLPTDAWLDH